MTVSVASRDMLHKAMEFFFAGDYFMGFDTMILWWRKAVDDLANCSQELVKNSADKIEMKLNNLRMSANYWTDLVDEFNAKSADDSATTDEELYNCIYDFIWDGNMWKDFMSGG